MGTYDDDLRKFEADGAEALPVADDEGYVSHDAATWIRAARSRRSPFQGGFRWNCPRPEGLGCSVKPLRGLTKRTASAKHAP